jgi:hypothetical protein
MPDGSIATMSKDFEPPIRIDFYTGGFLNISYRRGLLPEGGPGAPAITRSSLPDVPEISIRATGEDFNAPIGIFTCDRV